MPSRRRLGRHSILAIAWQRRRQPHLQPGHHGRVLHGRPSKQTNTVDRVVAQTCDMGTNVPRFFQAPQIGGGPAPPFSCRADRGRWTRRTGRSARASHRARSSSGTV